MQDKLLSVPSKGKAREDAHWQLGWWELYPLTDGPRKSIAWSKSSVIFSAHPTQPLVLARHFSSSKQFVVPSPEPVATSPHSYEPPAIISISPSEEWLFAYFPGRDGSGAGCLWKKGHQLDKWTVRDWWSYARGSGVVTAAWTHADREWVVTDSGHLTRLPPLGPVVPVNSPTLLLVTQTQQINVCFLPPVAPSLKIIRASLVQPSASSETQPLSPELPASGPGGRRVCVNAAIGMSYNESSMLIAMRSHLLPSYTPGPSFNAMDLDLPLDIAAQSTSSTDTLFSSQWESWGEESTIDVCEVILESNGLTLGVVTKPLSPLCRPGSHLTDLQFCPVHPEPTAPASPLATKDPRRQPKEATPEKKGNIYLAASILDFGDHTGLPKSEVTLYSFSHGTPSAGSSRWLAHTECTRVFDTGTLAFLAPSPARNCLMAGFLDSSGIIRRAGRKPKEVPIGSMAVLNLPDLSIDERWDRSQLVSTSDNAGRDVPISVALSPNIALLGSFSPSITVGARTSVHALPRRHNNNSSLPSGVPSLQAPKSDLSKNLCVAIHSRRSPSDIVQALIMPSTPADMVTSTLENTMVILENNSFGMQDMCIEEVLGVETEVYLGRARNAETQSDKDDLTPRAKTAHELCSVAALCSAFEDCRDEEAYDLEAIWQLVSLSSWLIELSERLMKECIHIGDTIASADTVPESVTSSPILLHVVHPYALKNLQSGLGHIKRFRDNIGSMSARGENAQIAKDVLVDTVDCSGLNLGILIPLLDEVAKLVRNVSAWEMRRSLALCTPIPQLSPLLRQITNEILNSQAIDRPKLFIKASDLVDGVSRLSVVDRPKEKDIDVVSKGLLLHRGPGVLCVRCGGRSEMVADAQVAGRNSLRWRAWEKGWAMRCVCGGAWTMASS